MWKVSEKPFLKIMMIFILILIVYSAINTKNFETQLAVDKETSEINISSVLLRGTLVRFPLGIHYIRGSLVIGDKTYKLTGYKEMHFNEILKTRTYNLEFIDRNNLGLIHGTAYITGDIIQADIKFMSIQINITDRNNGYSHTEAIDCYTVEK